MFTQVRQWFVTKWQSKKGKAGFFGMLYGFVMWVLDAPGRWHQLGQWRTDMPTMHLHASQFLAPGIFAVGVVLLLWDGRKGAVSSPNESLGQERIAKTPATPVVSRKIRHYPGKAMCDMSPEELVALYAHNTTVRAKILSEVYIGTWLEVSGIAANADLGADGDSFVVVRGELSNYRTIMCYFHGAENDAQIRLLGKDKPVTILGKVVAIDPRWIELQLCEFIHD